MGIWRSAAGSVRLRITSADFPESLKNLTALGIDLRDVVYEDNLSVCVTLNRTDCRIAVKKLEAKGDQCTVIRRNGIFWSVLQIKNRPVLLLGILLMVFLSFYIPSKVYFIQIQGNDTVPSRAIAEKVREIGLEFGCDREKIQNEHLKNILLESIPQLDWVGITTTGCVATVRVKEKLSEEKPLDPKYLVASLVAACDGVVESVTATRGFALCRPGQAVQQGQVLISGYEDLGLSIKATYAQGEVYARTQRFLQAITPVTYTFRKDEGAVHTNFSVLIGKKQINFSQDSGISPTGCVKMYDKKYLTLPGGFQLPVALIIEKIYDYDMQSQKCNATSFSWLESFSKQYLQRQMIAGEIVDKKIAAETLDELFVLSGEYACREQIGQLRIEENLRQDGEDR